MADRAATRPTALPLNGLWILFFALTTHQLAGLGSPPLMDTDEPRYAETARVMLETGDWLHPTFNGAPRHAKPPLVYWLIAGSYSQFGVTTAAARVPAYVFGLLIAGGLYLVGRRYAGHACGFVGAICWLTLPQTAIWAKACLTDNVLTFFIAGSCVALFAASRAELRRKPLFYLLASVFSALAMWTKGPVGLVVPGAVWLAYHRRPAILWYELRAGAGMAVMVAALLTAPWYLSQWASYGSGYIETFIGGDNVARFTEAPPNQMEWWSPLYYIGVLIVAAFPWVAGLPWALGKLHDARRSGELPEAHDDLARFSLTWFIVVVVMFSLSATKQPQYIQSAYPALALLLAVCVTGGGECSTRLRRISIGLTAATGAIFTAALALLPRIISADAARRGVDLFEDGAPPKLLVGLTMFAVLGTVGCLAALMDRRLRDSSSWAWVAAFGAMLVLQPTLSVFRETVVPYRVRPFKYSGVMLAGALPDNGVIYTWGHGVRSSAVVFYSGHNTVEVPIEEGHRLPDLLKPGDALITRRDKLDELPEIEGLNHLEAFGEPTPWIEVFMVGEREWRFDRMDYRR